MAATGDETVLDAPTPAERRSRMRGLWPRRWRFRISLILLGLIIAVFGGLYLARERIAGNFIDDYLTKNGIEATYNIVSIEPGRQIIENLVIGDSDAPDFTARRVIVRLTYGFRAPNVSRIELTEPRLYGTYLDGKLSFGSLDPLIFTGSDEPPALPTLNVTIRDGRALIETDFGAIAAKLDGRGQIDDGFAGKLALTAPGIGTADCSAGTATLYGDLTTSSGAPSFKGPVRLSDVTCADAKVARADTTAQVTLSQDFASAKGALALTASSLGYQRNALSRLAGDVDFSWNDSGLKVGHDLEGARLVSDYGSLRAVRAEGSLRTSADLARADWNLDLSGEGIDFADNAIPALRSARAGTKGTLLEPLLAKFERNFTRETSGGNIAARVTLRRTEDGTSILIPDGRLENARGNPVVALSRIAFTSGARGSRLSGNFVTGGEGLPRISGRMERSGGGLALRAAMAEYSAGADRLAVPRLQIAQDRFGRLTFDGLVRASGKIPGGRVAGLELPVEGVWSRAGGLALGRRCTPVRFASLSVAQLALRGNRLVLCPQGGSAMVRYGDALRIGMETRGINLAGSLGSSPAVLAASAARFTYPGGFAMSDVRAIIGTQGRAVRLTAADLTGTSGSPLGGEFSGGTAALDVVPLDLSDMSGRWAFNDDVLTIGEGAFVLTDRFEGTERTEARFEPLAAQGATLSLADSVITAIAELRHPETQRLVTRVNVTHDLDRGVGGADLAVPGLTFDEQLRPRDITALTEGVVALADGTITGNGRIDWNPDGITSTGTFSTDRLDLAAAFGPIQGLKGTIEFTDLLGLTTAPGQEIEIGALNPGIEVVGGKLRFSLTDGEIIGIEDARWPFMGGTLILRPVEFAYGEPGARRYVFEIIGLDAAAFVAQIELGNIGATGIFDGTVPIAFDAEGNGSIEGGLLISRPPGGNVSYIGELTYEDLGAIADFAFQALRSLDYNQMSVGLSGDLAGEIITSFNIDGVRQGEGAKRNFLTRRLASLPIKFRINIRSQNFYQLASIARLYLDPESIRDPRSLGLFREENGRLVPIVRPQEPPAQDAPSDEPGVQPQAIQNRESDDMP